MTEGYGGRREGREGGRYNWRCSLARQQPPREAKGSKSTMGGHRFLTVLLPQDFESTLVWHCPVQHRGQSSLPSPTETGEGQTPVAGSCPHI